MLRPTATPLVGELALGLELELALGTGQDMVLATDQGSALARPLGRRQDRELDQAPQSLRRHPLALDSGLATDPPTTRTVPGQARAPLLLARAPPLLGRAQARLHCWCAAEAQAPLAQDLQLGQLGQAQERALVPLVLQALLAPRLETARAQARVQEGGLLGKGKAKALAWAKAQAVVI